jgi:hypothetical protein
VFTNAYATKVVVALSVLGPAPHSLSWVHQDLRLPIPVTSKSRVLLQTSDMVDADCLGLNTETSLVALSWVPAPTPVGIRSRVLPPHAIHTDGVAFGPNPLIQVCWGGGRGFFVVWSSIPEKISLEVYIRYGPTNAHPEFGAK